jgi:hypothetical protein
MDREEAKGIEKLGSNLISSSMVQHQLVRT